MMITTKKTKGTRLLLLSFSIVFLLAVAYLSFFRDRASDALKTEIFSVSGGWGYRILRGERVYIYQPFIPGIPGKKPFPDRKSALGAAKLVKLKLDQGKLPGLTREDMIKAGLDSLGNSN